MFVYVFSFWSFLRNHTQVPDVMFMLWSDQGGGEKRSLLYRRPGPGKKF